MIKHLLGHLYSGKVELVERRRTSAIGTEQLEELEFTADEQLCAL